MYARFSILFLVVSHYQPIFGNFSLLEVSFNKCKCLIFFNVDCSCSPSVEMRLCWSKLFFQVAGTKVRSKYPHLWPIRQILLFIFFLNLKNSWSGNCLKSRLTTVIHAVIEPADIRCYILKNSLDYRQDLKANYIIRSRIFSC